MSLLLKKEPTILEDLWSEREDVRWASTADIIPAERH